MDGATIYSCALEELSLVFWPLGNQLHAQLRDLTSRCSDELSWIIELLEKDSLVAFQEPLRLGKPLEVMEEAARPAPTTLPASHHWSPGPGCSEVSTTGTFPDYKKGGPKAWEAETEAERRVLEGKKSKHACRGTHLWEFIWVILIHLELHEGFIKWENRQEGNFKAMAQLWGQKKKNSNVTYKKLSWAVRYYYK
ncbi:ETS-related transcription factor Elf-3 [Heterocephalus glaber]|uniref:ETS-related transcription factor Elf-3 n=1 Tax=Heterocephalus glaber TaxID=10181 RepID=G5C823_HETGA|nr:ETS-related transcription factor Elf-3 [Heterocephalus glaber]